MTREEGVEKEGKEGEGREREELTVPKVALSLELSSSYDTAKVEEVRRRSGGRSVMSEQRDAAPQRPDTDAHNPLTLCSTSTRTNPVATGWPGREFARSSRLRIRRSAPALTGPVTSGPSTLTLASCSPAPSTRRLPSHLPSLWPRPSTSAVAERTQTATTSTAGCPTRRGTLSRKVSRE